MTRYLTNENNTISIKNRRYMGSKAKLTDWIMDVILKNTENVHSFCDIFAGTGVVANASINRFDHIIINDFLCSNNVIYRAFFGNGTFDKHKLKNILSAYNSINASELPENYFSVNFGGKYFEKDLAKLTGYIRQDIENRKEKLTSKEYYILLATLIYNIDRYANTVGHFDAYIKKEIPYKKFILFPIAAHSYNNVSIYQEDANVLAKKIESDVVYVDPPYNSRQYCDAYHVYENLIRWEKPDLTGVALKFKQADKKSSYCTHNAIKAFDNLVQNLNARYIVLSYNNMAQKGNGRSNAKMDDGDILTVLNKRGTVMLYAQEHKAFSAGKSDISNHKERLFLCKIDQ